MTRNEINLVIKIHYMLYRHIFIINLLANIILKTYNLNATSPHKWSLMKIMSVVMYKGDPFAHRLTEPITLFLLSDLIIFFT